jgi:hypothetical protein
MARLDSSVGNMGSDTCDWHMKWGTLGTLSPQSED